VTVNRPRLPAVYAQHVHHLPIHMRQDGSEAHTGGW
jgi:hypothetical protein